ncbi:sortilin (neurotensin receptor 3) [Roseivirga pacifica]|uniref:Sortilin, neurotensin receptor 3 n=2 Tax=Roseivirga pacifica TaxID=1267423 RepID=A0A1I0RAA3_9BACT|nr:sortilin (neurotensin receptor 3) [Roseivirga pacifica]SEW37543.1 Sortilin, neurotensin receptor 3 [Roseivirga pacifica]
MLNMKLRVTALLAILAITTTQAQQLTSEMLNGLKLRNIGPATMSGRIVDLAVVESDLYTFYAATSTGGVWKTTNNGITFEPVFEKEGTHSVGDIAVHQAQPNIVWVGTGERANRQSSSWGDGVYKSHDGGKTWTNMGLKDSHHIGRIVLHPTDTNIVYVAAMGHLWGPNEERGLYKSTDGGNTWDRLIYVDEDTGVVDVAMDPEDSNILYAATYQRRRRPYGFDGGGPGSALHKSTDGGKTWKELTNGLPEGEYGRIGITIYRKNPDVVFISLEQGFQYNASTAYNERRAGLYRSKDKGESWEHMSDWNPRPMYASQPLVDPSDESRVYMMNQYSYSSDSGRTFTAPRQSLHGDDRIIWVNPNDSRHVIKGDDGGIGISYDRGIKWLYVSNLPLSQYYRVSVDMAKPYNVYGGLQDNGSWVGPSETYRRDGIINADWKRLGGGDGFLNLAHHANSDVVYTESQYLGLARLDMNTGQRQSIRPGDPQGKIGARRNWDAWGPGVPEPELGNAMAPGNWDGPFFLSYHDPHTIYAGTDQLWKSTDNGATWKSLGNLTTKVNRRELKIMGRRADEHTPSLDDGIPYYPTLTAIAEDKHKPGMLYAGTDDGLLQVSWDDGQTWNDVSGQLNGLPKGTWINTFETSSHTAGTAYVAINNYRNNDFNNYVYKTNDFGKTWTSIEGDLPADRVARTLREDPKNPNLLYLGTELGLFISNNGGKNWVELKSNMPTLPFNDLVIHPRDNDLVLGTHGRGVWILDEISALQELTPEVLSQQAALFSIGEAEQINYTNDGAHTGDMYYRGENPRYGAKIDYYLKSEVSKENITLEVFDLSGKLVQTLNPTNKAGLHRVHWNLQHESLKATNSRPNSNGRRRGYQMGGPVVMPGVYVAKLTVNGQQYEQSFKVSDDPRLNIDIDVRREWNESLFEITSLYEQVIDEMKATQLAGWKVDELKKEGVSLDEKTLAPLDEINRKYNELFSRTRSLYFEVSSYIGPWTTDQHAQFNYYTSMISKLAAEREQVVKNTIPRLNRGLKKDQKITIE